MHLLTLLGDCHMDSEGVRTAHSNYISMIIFSYNFETSISMQSEKKKKKRKKRRRKTLKVSEAHAILTLSLIIGYLIQVCHTLFSNKVYLFP